MALDPRFDAFLAEPRNTVRPPPPHVPMDKVRRAANAAMAGASGPNMHAVAALTAEAEGKSVPLRLYRPAETRPLPLILFCHGGGFVWGDLDTHDALCRMLAAQSGATVASVDYRLAPETPFPGAIEDIVAALAWLREKADQIGVDASRIALCGDSAGASLAVGAALLATRSGAALRHLALFYPALDPACDSGSQHAFGEGHMLTRDAMLWFWRCYLGDNPASFRDALATPLRATLALLATLPPVSISTAEFDILRDEGEAFADLLAAAGVPVTLRRCDGMIHGFLSLPLTPDRTEQAIADVSADLRHALAA